MIDFIKSLPTPVLIASCVVIYILIGAVVSFIAGLFDDGSEDLIAVGAFWIFALPFAALVGVAWIISAPFKLGAKISKSKMSKPKVSDFPPITNDTNDWAALNELRDYFKEEEE